MRQLIFHHSSLRRTVSQLILVQRQQSLKPSSSLRVFHSHSYRLTQFTSQLYNSAAAINHEENLKRNFSSTSSNSNSNSGNEAENQTTSIKSVSILNDLDLLSQIPMQDIRNFCFIAHVDHGKSSLASRVLELSGNLGLQAQSIAMEYAQRDTTLSDDELMLLQSTTSTSANKNTDNKEDIELLDTLSVERERGITVKASAASMLFSHPSAVGPTKTLLLNMVDTPGHADFGFEVTRSLANVQGAVILFDAVRYCIVLYYPSTSIYETYLKQL